MQKFLLDPKRLRELLLKKATTCVWNKAARKIQKWWRGRLGRAAFLKEVRTAVASCTKVQVFWRYYLTWVLYPRRKRKAWEEATVKV